MAASILPQDFAIRISHMQHTHAEKRTLCRLRNALEGDSMEHCMCGNDGRAAHFG